MHVRHGARHLTSTSLLLSAHFTDGAAVNPLRPVSPPPPGGGAGGEWSVEDWPPERHVRAFFPLQAEME